MKTKEKITSKRQEEIYKLSENLELKTREQFLSLVEEARFYEKGFYKFLIQSKVSENTSSQDFEKIITSIEQDHVKKMFRTFIDILTWSTLFLGIDLTFGSLAANNHIESSTVFRYYLITLFANLIIKGTFIQYRVGKVLNTTKIHFPSPAGTKTISLNSIISKTIGLIHTVLSIAPFVGPAYFLTKTLNHSPELRNTLGKYSSKNWRPVAKRIKTATQNIIY